MPTLVVQEVTQVFGCYVMLEKKERKEKKKRKERKKKKKWNCPKCESKVNESNNSLIRYR